MEVVRYLSYGLLVGVPVAVTFSEQVGCIAKISGPSMRPALNPVCSMCHFKYCREDIVWVSKWRQHGPKPGDVVALKSPVDPSDKMVKRVVAVENHTLITRSFKRRRVVIPEGHLWVEGDNSKRSKDCNVFGPVSKGLIIGTVTHVLWPPHRIQRVEHKLSAEQHKRRLCDDFDDL